LKKRKKWTNKLANINKGLSRMKISKKKKEKKKKNDACPVYAHVMVQSWKRSYTRTKYQYACLQKSKLFYLSI